MKISNAQIAAMNDLMLSSFARQTARKLELEDPAWKAEETPLERDEFVVSCLKHAISLGIQHKEQLSKFMEMVVGYDLGIPLAAGLLQEFKRKDITPTARLENLLLRLLSGRDLKEEIKL